MNKPFKAVWFGNFYRPAYDDREYCAKTAELIARLGFTSCVLDCKDWEDIRARCAGGEASQYVKSLEWTMEALGANGIGHTYLSMYLNGDNLYPDIRFSAPVFGESVTAADGSDGRWYKYWSPKAREAQVEHVSQMLRKWGSLAIGSEGEERIPIVSMWDPITAPCFSEEGRARYLSFISRRLGDERASEGMEALWNSREAEVVHANRLWQLSELEDYFSDMQGRLHALDSRLLTVPDLAQWGCFLTVDGSLLGDVGLSDLWDTANRGLDIFALAPHLDMASFISVPCAPSGDPDAYVTSYHHAMMRSANRGRPFWGGLFLGRFLHNDLYSVVTPEEVIGSVVASGASGYISYGINGLDDGGLLDKMGDGFLGSLERANRWMDEVVPALGKRARGEVALLFPSAMALSENYAVPGNAERRLDSLGWWRLLSDLGLSPEIVTMDQIAGGALDGIKVLVMPESSNYSFGPNPDAGKALREFGGLVLASAGSSEAAATWPEERSETCPLMPVGLECAVSVGAVAPRRLLSGEKLASWSDGSAAVSRTGSLVRFGFSPGLSVVSKKIRHVPRSGRNNAVYPLALSGTEFFRSLLSGAGVAAAPCPGVERALFENGAVLVNHTSYPAETGGGTIAPRSALFVRKR